jgi:hypothetical protein
MPRWPLISRPWEQGATPEPRPKTRSAGAVAIRRVGAVIGLAGVRVVNAWFYHTPLDVFIERTVLMILLAYVVNEIRVMRTGRLRKRPESAAL